MTSPLLRHQAISASAGSGKTFQLAHRYIRLLAADIEPDSIVALTFSRKAAGEIFDSIVTYLCEAAEDAETSALTSSRINSPAIPPEGYIRMLKKLVRVLHRLHVGTLDSFIVGILRSFPFELGIPPGITLMESGGADATMLQQRILSSLFRGDNSSSDSQQNLLSAFILQIFAGLFEH